ncbi:MAG: hypothetical protein WBN02_05740 [Sedimenticolaceae bacterium]
MPLITGEIHLTGFPTDRSDGHTVGAFAKGFKLQGRDNRFIGKPMIGVQVQTTQTDKGHHAGKPGGKGIPEETTQSRLHLRGHDGQSCVIQPQATTLMAIGQVKKNPDRFRDRGFRIKAWQ